MRLIVALIAFASLPTALWLLGLAGMDGLMIELAGLALLLAAAQLVVALTGMMVLCLGVLATIVATSAASICAGLDLGLGWVVLLAMIEGIVLGGLLALPATRVSAPVLMAGSALLMWLAPLFLPAEPVMRADPSPLGLGALLLLAPLLVFAMRVVERSALAEGLRLHHVNPALAALAGMRLSAARCVCLALAGGILGVAGVVFMVVGEVRGTPPDLLALSLAAVAAVLLGGRRHLAGTLFAAVPLIVLPQLSSMLVPGLPDLTLVTGLAVMILLLLVRDDGGLALDSGLPPGDALPDSRSASEAAAWRS